MVLREDSRCLWQPWRQSGVLVAFVLFVRKSIDLGVESFARLQLSGALRGPESREENLSTLAVIVLGLPICAARH